MAETTPPSSRETWLVAAWPGMGNVAVGAAAYLVTKLNAKLVHELPARDVFDLDHIVVKDGLAKPGRLPRNMFFQWINPKSNHDLLIFLGESQPTERGHAFCHRLLDYAMEHNIRRVLTFAAMATQLHPANEPRVFGVATNGQAIRDLQALEVTILKEGQISGLNGVLIAAASERGLPGMCLLGELPYFAAAVPNPKASHAVLEVFGTMADVQIDFTELNVQAQAVEKGLLELLEKLQEAARQQAEQTGEEGAFIVPEFAEPAAPKEDAPAGETPKAPALDYATRRRLESLFDAANKDRSQAFQLKQELDRLGVFKQYEDRFLDLFKKGE